MYGVLIISTGCLNTFEVALAVTHDGNPAVGRHIESPDIIPGKLYVAGDFYSVFDGKEFSTTAGREALQVNPECHVTWVSYTVGNPMPAGAVIGGLLSKGDDFLRNDLYVIQAKTLNDRLEFGYYDPETGLGYVGQQGVNTYTQMDLLILLWTALSSMIRGCSAVWWFGSTVTLNTTAADAQGVQLGIGGLWAWHSLCLNIWVISGHLQAPGCWHVT